MESSSVFTPWRITRGWVVLTGSPWTQVTARRIELPAGGAVEEYLVPWNRETVSVVAESHGQAVLVRQLKHVLGRVVYEFPAGYLTTPEEDPLLAAMRELREETGLASSAWQYLGAFYREPGRSQSRMHFFLARACTRVGNQALDETEDLTYHLVPFRTLPAMMQEGRIASVHCLAALTAAVYLAGPGAELCLPPPPLTER